MYVYGPVPSRRLGRSLGINNIPPKACSYACIYCQVGRTTEMMVERKAYFEPVEIVNAVTRKLRNIVAAGESIDYLTFVPDGEPTLDLNLGLLIEMLKPLGVKIAVISNASLLWREDVWEDLLRADWVSLKIDAAEELVWREINRPHGKLSLTRIKERMVAFAGCYPGDLVTETMLVRGVNDHDISLSNIANFLAGMKPHKVYISIPTRPPAESWVEAPDEEIIHRAFQVFSEGIDHVELLTGYEGNAFSSSGDIKEDLLSISAVHPLREEAVLELLAQNDADWNVVRKLIAEGSLVEIPHRGTRFYLRKMPRF